MKQFDVKLLVPLKILAETAEDAIEKVRKDLGNYWIPEHCLDAKEAMKMKDNATSSYEKRYRKSWNEAPLHCKAMWMDAWNNAIDQAVGILETHHVSVGNSAAGELAAEWTMANLEEIIEALRLLRTDDRYDNEMEIALLKAEVSKLKLKGCALKINLDLARGEQEQTISGDGTVCRNCDEPLPGGCGGRFSNEYDCMWRYT